ncbi:family protein [Stylonychia lemnae]|uniref:Family protein n=1 Tax=Stylonychia lemnae TaxID=5949 RepID=A0A078AZS1_STYLE|nr:family protein [Stylonychia lemnae]|eukprot:CDW87905.1 family protein [Stylonychia lemnae]
MAPKRKHKKNQPESEEPFLTPTSTTTSQNNEKIQKEETNVKHIKKADDKKATKIKTDIVPDKSQDVQHKNIGTKNKVSFQGFISKENQADQKIQSHKVTQEDFMKNENLQELSLMACMGFFVKHSFRDVGRRKFHFSLAFCSVFIVVLASLVINTAVEKGPIIFLKLAEGQQGEIDAIITPFGQHKMKEDKNNNLFMNYTRITEFFSKENWNLSPRNFIKASQTVTELASNLYDPYDEDDIKDWRQSFDKQHNLPTREDAYDVQFQAKSQSNNILAFKTIYERKIEVGREYQYDPIDFGQCYLIKNDDLKIKEGQILFVRAPITNLMNQLIDHYNKEAIGNNKVKIPDNFDQLNVQFPCRIKYIDSLFGKIPQHSGSLILFEHDKLLELFSYYLPDPLHQEIYSDFHEYLRKPLLLDEFSDQVLFTMPSPRIQHYESPNIDFIRARLTNKFSQLEEGLGFYPIQVTSELLGVQRMVGLSKLGLVIMVLVQSCIFVIPAVISGFTLSIPCLKIFTFVLKKKLYLDIVPLPSRNAILQALFIGIVIPTLSSILPIQVAMKQNLNDALDYQRSKTQGVMINILQKGDKKMNDFIAFGTIATVFGISIYYLLPYSLLSLNLSLIMRIFIFILFGMIFALSLMALNVQRIIEVTFTRFFLYYEQNSIKVMVLKNLQAHRGRNKLTAIIYSLALGFVIFLVIAYKIQLQTMRLHEMRFRASYIQIQVEQNQPALIPKYIEPVLKNIMITDYIKAFSWIPREINRVKDLKLMTTRIVDHSRRNQFKIGLYGVTPSLFDSCHDELLEYDFRNENTSLSIVEQLYTPRGTQSAGMGAILPKKTSLDLSDYRQTFVIEMLSPLMNRMYEIRPLFTMNRAPGFTMPGEEIMKFNDLTILVSMPIYAHLAQIKIDEIPFERLTIRLKDPYNMEHRSQLKKALVEQFDSIGLSDKEYAIRDSIEDLKSLKDVELILQIIFSVIIPITMFLCFFSLSSSMGANLYEQCKEIAILRAIGFLEKNIQRIYIFEAFILVTSSSVLGIIIGCFLGWIMALQQGMFIQLPFKFEFPYGASLQIFAISIVCAFMSTYGPTRQLMSKSIPNIMRTA